jgi:hypothetical protein
MSRAIPPTERRRVGSFESHGHRTFLSSSGHLRGHDVCEPCWRRFLGCYPGRGVWIEMIRVQVRPGARWTSTAPRGRRLTVVLAGRGACGRMPIERLAALQIEGETLDLSAASETELFVVGLPPVVVPTEEPEQFDNVEITDAVRRTAQAPA